MKRALVLLSLLGACSSRTNAGQKAEVTVAVATSLRAVLPELVASYQAQGSTVAIIATYGSSGALRQQVQGGAPVDAVLFADDTNVDALVASGHADATTRRVIATNRLVLIAPESLAAPLTFSTLDQLGENDKLAIGDPASVPAGKYAQTALAELGKWDALKDNLVLGGDVAAVLAYVRRGEVAAGIVYATEVHGIGDITVVEDASPTFAPRPLVVVAAVKGSEKEAAAHFLQYVGSPAGQALLGKHGFGPPP